MAFVHDLLSRLFGRNADGKATPLPISEPLKRTEAYAEAYGKWLDSADPDRLRGVLRRMYDHTARGASTHLGFRIYDSPQAAGFYADRSLGLRDREFSFLIDRFRDALLDEGYRVYHSDRRHRESEEGVEVIDRHFLKPDHVEGGDLRSKPGYGNVTLEMVTVNNQPEYLKVMTTRHTGPRMASPKPFEELVELLIGT